MLRLNTLSGQLLLMLIYAIKCLLGYSSDIALLMVSLCVDKIVATAGTRHPINDPPLSLVQTRKENWPGVDEGKLGSGMGFSAIMHTRGGSRLVLIAKNGT